MSTEEESSAVTDTDLESLSEKLDGFAGGLEPTEQALFSAMLEQAGGVGESEVEGFSHMGFKAASMLAMDPLRGGLVNTTRANKGTGPYGGNWSEWIKTTTTTIGQEL